MEGSQRRRPKWALSHEAFDRLLLVLDPDRVRAGEQYERIRQKLTYLFECRGCHSPSDLVDETFDRGARKILELKEEQIRDAASFLCGIAHNMLKEHWRDPWTRRVALDQLPPAREPAEVEKAPSDAEWRDRIRECLARCIERLAPHDRALIGGYYQGEKRAKKDARRRLAEELAITMNALALRAHRIRLALEACVNECLGDMGSAFHHYQ